MWNELTGISRTSGQSNDGSLGSRVAEKSRAATP
jgi:hypothetical protein